MKKYSFLCLALLLIVILSCEKGSELDFERDPTFVELKADSLKSKKDTIGVPLLFGQKYFVLSRKEQRMLFYAGYDNMYNFSGVAIPESDNASIDEFPDSVRVSIFSSDNLNYFFGFPDATELNGEVMVVGQRKTSENSVNDFSDNFIMLKDEQGNWQQTDLFKYAPYGNEFITSRAIVGKSSTDQVVIKAKGLLVSDGSLSKWKHYPYAFNTVINSGREYVGCGATITNSSKFGLFFATGQEVNKSVEKKGTIISIDPTNGTAKEALWGWVPKIPSSFGPLVDFPLLEEVVFISIEHDDLPGYKNDIVGFGISADKVYQFVYKYKENHKIDSLKFEVQQTSVEGSFVRHSPVNVSYNPVTKRFEMIHSSPYLLELYSISPEDMLNNTINKLGLVEWRKEATLLEREVSVRGQGMHPVGSIIDTKENIQRVFISMGDEYPSRSGIFELTRTLETDKLASHVANRRKILFHQDF